MTVGYKETKLDTLDPDKPLGFEPIIRIEHDLVCTIEQVPKGWLDWGWVFWLLDESNRYVIKGEDGKVLYKVTGGPCWYNLAHYEDVYDVKGNHLFRMQKDAHYRAQEIAWPNGKRIADVAAHFRQYGLYVAFNYVRPDDPEEDQYIKSFTNKDHDEGVIQWHSKVVAAFAQEPSTQPQKGLVKYRLRVSANMDFAMVLALVLAMEHNSISFGEPESDSI